MIPAGPKAWDRAADEVRRRFLVEIKERRSPRTTATIDQLLDRYLDQHQGGRRTVTGYREYVDKHVRPFVGKRKVGDLDADILTNPSGASIASTLSATSRRWARSMLSSA